MLIKTIGTGSSGNAYALMINDDILLLECGMKFSEVKKAIDFQADKIQGCLLTHEHLDHAKYLKNYLNAGINVYGTKETFEKLNQFGSSFIRCVQKDVKQKAGNFTIIPFGVNHDAVNPVNYLISHPRYGLILFITDTNKIPYTFKDVKCYLIEANFSEKKLREKYYTSTNNKWINTRVFNSHLSIEGCIRYLNQCNLLNTEKIVLIHLSDTQSDERLFKQKIIEEIGVDCSVASNGMLINLF